MDDSKVFKASEMIENVDNLHEFKESEGYVADVDANDHGDLKTAKNGHTVLIPQPSDSAADTLNWSPVRKHVILFIISFAALLPDYGSATGAVTLLPQAAYVFLAIYSSVNSLTVLVDNGR